MCATSAAASAAPTTVQNVNMHNFCRLFATDYDNRRETVHNGTVFSR